MYFERMNLIETVNCCREIRIPDTAAKNKGKENIFSSHIVPIEQTKTIPLHSFDRFGFRRRFRNPVHNITLGTVVTPFLTSNTHWTTQWLLYRRFLRNAILVGGVAVGVGGVCGLAYWAAIKKMTKSYGDESSTSSVSRL